MDNVTYFKNFSMGTELDIAGRFIYNGIKSFDYSKNFKDEGEIFNTLYLISVGIERLQKILLVLCENITEEKKADFEESLKTHSHQDLHRRIKEKIQISFTPEQNEFLQLLTNFYMKYRYSRFCLNGKYSEEQVALISFLEKKLNIKIEITDFFNITNNNSTIKNFFGKIVGGISTKYYKAIKDKAGELNIYTYELICDSPASKVFLGNFNKNNLSECINIEKIAIKELLLAIANSKTDDKFMEFLKEIEPLDIDIAMIPEYINEICNGNIPQSLVDEVSSLYDEMEYDKERKERIDIINLIDDSRIIWDTEDVEE